MFLWNLETDGEVKSEQIVAQKIYMCTHCAGGCEEKNWTIAEDSIYLFLIF